MIGVPLVIAMKLCRRGPKIPLRQPYSRVKVEGLAEGDSVWVYHCGDGEHNERIVLVVEDNMTRSIEPSIAGGCAQAELRGNNGSEVNVWLE